MPYVPSGRALHGGLAFLPLDLALQFGLPIRQPRVLVRSLDPLGLEGLPLVERGMRLKELQIADQTLITARFARLALQRTNLPFYFFDDVREAQKVRFRRLKFPQGLLFLRLVFGDPRRFLENGAPILRATRENRVDLALLHDGISAPTDARIHEHLVDVFQTARRFVQQIFRTAIAKNAPGDRDLMPVESESLLAFREGHRHFRQADRRARIRAGENHIGHFAAAQGFGGLFPEHPADRIQHIGFSASIRPDDTGHAAMKFKNRFRSKRLKAEEFERLEIHDRGRFLGEKKAPGLGSAGQELGRTKSGGKPYLAWSEKISTTTYGGYPQSGQFLKRRCFFPNPSGPRTGAPLPARLAVRPRSHPSPETRFRLDDPTASNLRAPSIAPAPATSDR